MKLSFPECILYEDENFLIINKTPYLSTLDDRSSEGKTSVLQLARAYNPAIQIGHRLDKETSGALAIAKNPEAYRHLSMAFEHRKVEKIYHAFVQGIQDYDNVKIDKPIAQLGSGGVKIDKENGKPAVTYFSTIKAYKKNTLIECRPVTGRMHQIRIHLALMGSPIIQDEFYGGKPLFLSELKKRFYLKQETEEQPLITRVALHAQALVFPLMNDEMLRVEAPYPKDIKALHAQLEKNV